MKTESKKDAVFENDLIVITEDGWIESYVAGLSVPVNSVYLSGAEIEVLLDGLDKIVAYREKHGE